MVESDDLRDTKMALNNGSGAIPALGFGTLIPDPVATRTATRAALEAGFRLLDASERYRNQHEAREAPREAFHARDQAGGRVYRHEALEQQPSPRTRQTRLRGQSPEAPTRLPRP